MRRTRLQDLLDGLRRAAADERVQVLVVKVGGAGPGLAKVQELRAAIGDFRASGKLTVAWCESFGEFVRGNVPYYLATAFDRVYLQPSGSLGLTGVAVEQVFLHGALEKLGVDFETGKRYEYKSATDQLTQSGFTGPAREAIARLAESVTEQLVAGIAAGRGLTVERATELMAHGALPGPQALAEGLVDGLLYRDEVYDKVRREAGPDATLLYLQRYQRTQSLSDLPRRLGARPASCPASRRSSSPPSTRTAPSGTAAAGAAGRAAAAWARTRSRRRCARPRPTTAPAPSCCGSTAPAARTPPPT